MLPFSALGVVSGTVAIGGGGAKLVADGFGHPEAADKIPTSVSEGLIGIPMEKFTHDKSGLWRNVPGLLEGILLTSPEYIHTLTTPAPAIDKADKTFGTINNVIYSNDIKNGYQQSQQEQNK